MLYYIIIVSFLLLIYKSLPNKKMKDSKLNPLAAVFVPLTASKPHQDVVSTSPTAVRDTEKVDESNNEDSRKPDDTFTKHLDSARSRTSVRQCRPCDGELRAIVSNSGKPVEESLVIDAKSSKAKPPEVLSESPKDTKEHSRSPENNSKFDTKRHETLSNSRKSTSIVKREAFELFQESIQNIISQNRRTLLKSEVMKLVEKIISLRYNVGEANVLVIRMYLANKIYKSIMITDTENNLFQTNTNLSQLTIDLIRCIPPSLPSIHVSFWGLYRNQQACQPLVSFSERPETCTDKVWSVQTHDLKLFNKHCVEKVCCCPPIFGYSIPPSFFGNILNIAYECEIEDVHLNRYGESEEGNEFIHKEFFVDYEDGQIETIFDVESYTNQWNNVMNDIGKVIKESELKVNQAVHENDCNHSLLDVHEMEEFEDVPKDIKDLLHRSLSRESDSSISQSESDNAAETDSNSSESGYDSNTKSPPAISIGHYSRNNWYESYFSANKVEDSDGSKLTTKLVKDLPIIKFGSNDSGENLKKKFGEDTRISLQDDVFDSSWKGFNVFDKSYSLWDESLEIWPHLRNQTLNCQQAALNAS